MDTLFDKVRAGERLSPAEGEELFKQGSLFELGMLANHVRWQKHPEPIITYVIDRNINYTDICISACKFCAFFKAPEDKDGSVLSFAELGKSLLLPEAI